MFLLCLFPLPHCPDDLIFPEICLPCLWISIPNKVGLDVPPPGALPAERQLTGRVSVGRVPRHQGLLRCGRASVELSVCLRLLSCPLHPGLDHSSLQRHQLEMGGVLGYHPPSSSHSLRMLWNGFYVPGTGMTQQPRNMKPAWTSCDPV